MRGALSETVATVSLKTEKMETCSGSGTKNVPRPTLLRAGTVPETVPVRSLMETHVN